MNRLYLIISVVVCAVRAQIPGFGFCPDYLPMPHFDMNRFLGKWYEAERYFQFSEVAARCVVADYAVGPNGKIYISNEVTNRFTGVKRVIGGNMDLTGKKNEGRFVVKYDTMPSLTATTMSVLDTDYDNYAVMWSCSGLGPVNAQSAWLMTRERIPDTTTLQKAYGVLDRYKINRTFFVKTDQEGCAVAASDLNAALGIASTSTNVEQNADDQENEKKRTLTRAQPIVDVLFKKNEIVEANYISKEEQKIESKLKENQPEEATTKGDEPASEVETSEKSELTDITTHENDIGNSRTESDNLISENLEATKLPVENKPVNEDEVVTKIV
ncbi:apolipoprotein D-like [Anthonomus grandis grandis]|uniref:apolipoprotein D-like n=1 Tax=Anthonomus grandis grandis TaxID=2921223 RepID=UPI00216669DB|nr:apolipoprotein D-like [Anthonomus grandis grandis]